MMEEVMVMVVTRRESNIAAGMQYSTKCQHETNIHIYTRQCALSIILIIKHGKNIQII